MIKELNNVWLAAEITVKTTKNIDYVYSIKGMGRAR